MTPIDHLKGLFGLSCGFWMIYCFYIGIRIERFIVDRYEQETDLLTTAFFTNHVPFVRYMPDFFSSGIYAGHLTMCRWGWAFFKSKKVFKDINDPGVVTGHFSQKEIKLVKKQGISFLVIFMHAAAYYIFKLIWPEVFN